MNNNNVYGSFKVNVETVTPQLDNILEKDVKIEKKSVFVKPLSQKLLSEGWELNVPKPNFKLKIFTDQFENKIKRKQYLYNYFKINLAQLPNKLWEKQKSVYEEKIFSYSIAKNKRYIYIVNPTPVDTEIKELRNIITQEYSYSYSKKHRISELLQLLEDNNITGWVLIRGREILKKY